MVALKHHQPNLKYCWRRQLRCPGKSYPDELIKPGIAGFSYFAGFIKEESNPGSFSIANIYVMPSMKEGFGFMAMYYGLPVIASNKDGSVDALCNGSWASW